MTITARGMFHGTELTDIPVLNPGDWFGKSWLIELGGSYCPLFLIVEADSLSDAIDELAENERYGHQIIVDDADLGDYPEDDRHYGPNGEVLDLDHLLIHGSEGVACPFACRYFGEGLPADGVLPTEFSEDDAQHVIECVEAVSHPGKFEGESPITPHFHESGDGELLWSDDCGGGCAEGHIVDDSDRLWFPELAGVYGVVLHERSDGFVSATTCDTEAAYAAECLAWQEMDAADCE